MANTTETQRSSKNGGKGIGYRGRIAVAMVLLWAAFAFLVVRLTSLAVIQHDELSAVATSQQLRDTTVMAKRGTIYDRNMNVLAESAAVWTVAISPLSIDEDDYGTIADGLSELLEVDRDTVYQQCSEINYYSIIKRKVDKPVVDRIRAWMDEKDVSGITFTEDTKRYYPYGNFCAQVLGFVGTDNYGLSGIEAYYDDTLSGTAGRVISAQNAVGLDMYYEYASEYSAVDGYSLVLTIDEVIQHYLESALETAVTEHHVKNRATGIVMNVNTGEILAMATKGDFDPNNPLIVFDSSAAETLAAIEDASEYYSALTQAQQRQWNNKAISEIYEPGSVFKSVTASMALETGTSSLADTYYCPGYYDVTSEVRMNCANANGHGMEDFANALINSCNPAFIQIGARVGARNFYNYFRAFGLTEPTGIDLPGESGSTYYTASDLGVVQLASCSYGQSNAITPIQMITAFSAVVNGGNLVTPHLVSEILDAEGNIVRSIGTTVKRQVISRETSETMCGLLEDVVEHSNGANAYVAGYRIGGKSGTSQKLGGDEHVYVASFCAFAPADDPEIAILVILDEAHSYSIYGSTLAGPIVSSLMSEILPYLGFEADYTDEEGMIHEIATPYVNQCSLTQAYSSLQSRGLTYEVVGDGTYVYGQYPGAGFALPEGSVVMLYTDEEYTDKMVEVPDLSGRSVSSVKSLMSALYLNVRLEGTSTSGAIAVSQSAEPGTEVPAGTVITVSFVDQSLSD